MGSKGNMGIDRAALLHPGIARPAGGLVDAVRPRSGKRSVFRRGVNGVNFVLGKGLHSYGFGIGGETYVAIFVALDLLFVAFAIWRYRRSATASVALSKIEPERASAQL
jgi:hypothetical protein